jgi:hypothetical protein
MRNLALLLPWLLATSALAEHQHYIKRGFHHARSLNTNSSGSGHGQGSGNGVPSSTPGSLPFANNGSVILPTSPPGKGTPSSSSSSSLSTSSSSTAATPSSPPLIPASMSYDNSYFCYYNCDRRIAQSLYQVMVVGVPQ